MLIEDLESRRLLSAAVSEMYPGFYDVEGSDAADAIHVTVSQATSSFTLDGQTYSDVSYVYVHGNGGDDDISVISQDGPGPVGASITGDLGDDRLELNFDGAVSGGSGNDILYLSDSFRGAAHGDTGNDSMFISGLCYDAEILGDSGNDLIDCSNNMYRVVVRAGTGNDTVYGSQFNDQIYGDGGADHLYGNGGDDSFYASDGNGGQIDGGDGHDVIYATNYSANSVNVEEIYYF